MSDKLKACPCPFCGDTPGEDAHTLTDGGFKYGAIQCSCGAMGPDVRTEYKDWPHWKDAAIREWNSRAQLPSQGGEAVEVVGWRRLDRPYELTAYPSVCAMWHGVGYPVQALYTHPTDQVAEPDAELVELLRSKFPRIDPCQPVPLDEKAHCCEYTIYVERERLHRIIDAKMASLEVKP